MIKRFNRLKAGDLLVLNETTPIRYAGYGPTPFRTVPAGSVVKVTSVEPMPCVYQNNAYFVNCVEPETLEQVTVYSYSNADRLRKRGVKS